MDGQVLDTLEFQIHEPARISLARRTVCQHCRSPATKALEMADNLQAAISVADPEEAEIAVMRGPCRNGRGKPRRRIDEQVTPLLTQLDAATLSRLDQLLAANGITEVYLSTCRWCRPPSAVLACPATT
ncbi:MAG: hypothetical protein R3E54_03730 [Halioglobus sp.]